MTSKLRTNTMTFYIHVRFRHLFEIARYIRLSTDKILQFACSILFYFISKPENLYVQPFFLVCSFYFPVFFFSNRNQKSVKFEYIFFQGCQITKIVNHIFIFSFQYLAAQLLLQNVKQL